MLLEGMASYVANIYLLQRALAFGRGFSCPLSEQAWLCNFGVVCLVFVFSCNLCNFFKNCKYPGTKTFIILLFFSLKTTILLVLRFNEKFQFHMNSKGPYTF